MAKDYIPSNDAQFDVWFKFMNQYVAQKCGGSTPAWDHIPQAARTVLVNAYTAWYTAYGSTIGPHTKVDTEAKNDAKKAAKKVIRPFVNQYLRFPPVTDEDRTAMGIPNHDTKPTPTPKPKDIPEVEVRTPKPRVLQFPFRREGMKRWGKSDDVHGMELKWLFAEEPPEDLAKRGRSEFATKSPLELIFEDPDRGKKFFFIVRWETNTVKKGDWSAIYSAIVP